MGLWNQYIVGLDETQELIHKEMTKRHTATVEQNKYRAELKYLREQLNAQKEVALFLANIHYAQKQFLLGYAVSSNQELMHQARILLQEGMKSGHSQMIQTAGQMMIAATSQVNEMARSQCGTPTSLSLTFGQQPKSISPAPAPFSSYRSNW